MAAVDTLSFDIVLWKMLCIHEFWKQAEEPIKD